MMVENKLLVYQVGASFVLTRKSEKEVFDAEEFLRVLKNSKERLEWLKRDINEMEKMYQAARRIRDEEIKKGKRERDNDIRNI